MEDLQEFLSMCSLEEAEYMACALFISSKYGRAGTHEMSANLWGQVQYRRGILAEQLISPDVKITEAYNEGYRAAHNKAISIITKGL